MQYHARETQISLQGPQSKRLRPLSPLSPVSSLSRLTASHGKSHPSVVRDPAPTASGQSLSSAAAAHSAAFSRIQSHGSSLHKSRLKDMRNEEHMERTHTDYIYNYIYVYRRICSMYKNEFTNTYFSPCMFGDACWSSVHYPHGSHDPIQFLQCLCHHLGCPRVASGEMLSCSRSHCTFARLMSLPRPLAGSLNK